MARPVNRRPDARRVAAFENRHPADVALGRVASIRAAIAAARTQGFDVRRLRADLRRAVADVRRLREGFPRHIAHG